MVITVNFMLRKFYHNKKINNNKKYMKNQNETLSKTLHFKK